MAARAAATAPALAAETAILSGVESRIGETGPDTVAFVAVARSWNVLGAETCVEADIGTGIGRGAEAGVSSGIATGVGADRIGSAKGFSGSLNGFSTRAAFSVIGNA